MLELSHIQKSFDGTPVLKDISLCVQNGEIVSIARARKRPCQSAADPFGSRGRRCAFEPGAAARLALAP